MKNMINTLNSLPAKTRTSLMTYGNRPRVIYRFDSNMTNDAIQTLIDSAQPMGGGRRVDRALDEGVQLMRNSRQSVPRIVLLITAGRQIEVRNRIFAKGTDGKAVVL